jgi:hypothetical protein
MALKHSDIARTLRPFTLHAQQLMSQARAEVERVPAVLMLVQRALRLLRLRQRPHRRRTRLRRLPRPPLSVKDKNLTQYSRTQCWENRNNLPAIRPGSRPLSVYTSSQNPGAIGAPRTPSYGPGSSAMKLGVESRAQAVAVAARRGFL